MKPQVSSALDALNAAALRQDGPLIEVEIVATCEVSGSCKTVRGMALVDSGADRSAVASQLFPNAHLEGVYQAQGVTSEAVSLPVYSVTFRFPGTDLPPVDVERVAGTPHLEAQGLVALLGRDVLGRGRFTYDGPSGQFELTAPRGAAVISASSAWPGLALGGVAALGLLALWFWPKHTPCPPCRLGEEIEQ